MKAADKVFVFYVTLRMGFNTITAQAGSVSDSAVLERVEKEPEIYSLTAVQPRRKGIEKIQF
jgi:beta-galactosidase